MENFITPIKQNYLPHFNTASHRQGDWICVMCNNLNFSFRKKCNRCKTQTRQQNDMQPIYPYFYYVEPQTQHFNNQLMPHRQPLSQQCFNITVASATPKKQIQKLYSFSNKNTELPSVSPLLKKYNASKKSSNTVGISDVLYLQFENKNRINSKIVNTQNHPFWRAIDFDAPIQKPVRDFEFIYDRSGTNDVENEGNQEYSQDQANEQLQKLVNNIIL